MNVLYLQIGVPVAAAVGALSKNRIVKALSLTCMLGLAGAATLGFLN